MDSLTCLPQRPVSHLLLVFVQIVKCFCQIAKRICTNFICICQIFKCICLDTQWTPWLSSLNALLATHCLVLVQIAKCICQIFKCICKSLKWICPVTQWTPWLASLNALLATSCCPFPHLPQFASHTNPHKNGPHQKSLQIHHKIQENHHLRFQFQTN